MNKQKKVRRKEVIEAHYMDFLDYFKKCVINVYEKNKNI